MFAVLPGPIAPPKGLDPGWLPLCEHKNGNCFRKILHSEVPCYMYNILVWEIPPLRFLTCEQVCSKLPGSKLASYLRFSGAIYAIWTPRVSKFTAEQASMQAFWPVPVMQWKIYPWNMGVYDVVDGKNGCRFPAFPTILSPCFGGGYGK